MFGSYLSNPHPTALAIAPTSSATIWWDISEIDDQPLHADAIDVTTWTNPKNKQHFLKSYDSLHLKNKDHVTMKYNS